MGAVAVPLLVGSAVVGGFSKFQQAKKEKKAADIQAQFSQDLGERNATAILEQSRVEEQRLRRSRGRQIAATRAAIGASGVQLTGTPLDVLADQAAEAEQEALLVRFRGEVGAQEVRLGADIQTRQAKLQASAAKQRQFAAVVGTASNIGSTLLTAEASGIT